MASIAHASPVAQDDWDAYSKFQAEVGDQVQTLGYSALYPAESERARWREGESERFSWKTRLVWVTRERRRGLSQAIWS